MKKILIIIGLVLCASLAQAQTFTEYNTIGVVDDNSKSPGMLYFNSWYTDTLINCPAGEWVTVDISDLVPIDTGGVNVVGIMIISHGMWAETCSMTINFRAPSSTFDGGYCGQVVEAHNGGGQRSTYAMWVPVENGEFQFKWTRSGYAQWPYGCAYGISGSIQAYVR